MKDINNELLKLINKINDCVNNNFIDLDILLNYKKFFYYKI